MRCFFVTRKKSKLRLHFYPYTYARVSVMKGALLGKMQWQSLLKMGPNEVLRTLQDSDYQKEISELGVEKHDMHAFERALNGNLARMLAKLHRICDERLQEVLDVYLLRYDVANIKAVLRGKAAGVSSDEIAPLLLPSVRHSADYFISLMAKETLNAIVAVLHLSLDVAPDAPLIDIETALDRHYFDQLFSLTQRLAGEGMPLREFIFAELDVINIKIIFRLLKSRK